MSCLHVLMLEHTLCLSSHVPHRENCIWDHPLILLQLLCNIVFSVAFRGSSVGIFKFSQHHNTLPVFLPGKEKIGYHLLVSPCRSLWWKLITSGVHRAPSFALSLIRYGGCFSAKTHIRKGPCTVALRSERKNLSDKCANNMNEGMQEETRNTDLNAEHVIQGLLVAMEFN